MKKKFLLIGVLIAGAAAIAAYKFYWSPVPPPPPEPEEQISEQDHLRAEANRQFRRKDYQAAIGTFGRLIEKDPKDKSAFLGRGNAQLARMNYDAALGDYDAALAIDSSYADAYFARGTLHWLLGELALAEWDYSTTIQLAPNDDFYYSQLAKVLYEEKAPDKVKVLYREAYQKDSRRTWALDGWFGAMFELKEFDEILTEHDAIVSSADGSSSDPRSILAPGFYAGVVHIERKEFEQAIDVFERCVKRSPDEVNIEAYGHLANAYRQVAQVDKCKARLADYDRRTGRKTPAEWCDGGAG
jgi:tetratricopeptide (TPR) repeat protein